MHGARYIRSRCRHLNECNNCEFRSEDEINVCSEYSIYFGYPNEWNEGECDEINKLKGYVPQDNTPAPEVPMKPTVYLDSIAAISMSLPNLAVLLAPVAKPASLIAVGITLIALDKPKRSPLAIALAAVFRSHAPASGAPLRIKVLATALAPLEAL